MDYKKHRRKLGVAEEVTRVYLMKVRRSIVQQQHKFWESRRNLVSSNVFIRTRRTDVRNYKLIIIIM